MLPEVTGHWRTVPWFFPADSGLNLDPFDAPRHYKLILMRRLVAILAVAWLSISLIAPMLFAAGAESNLAACCRRNGQHHCASHHETGSGNGWQTARCP